MIAVQILNDLIYTLSNASPKLIDCLTKTKVLLYQIGRKDLVGWVNNEINGYQDEAELPSYRNVNAQVKGNVSNAAFLYSSHPLPTMHLSKTQQKNLHHLEMKESIGVLENLLIDNKHGLSRPLPLEISQLFDNASNRAAAADNREAFVSRLQLLGVFRGLSDDFDAQDVRCPRDQFSEGN